MKSSEMKHEMTLYGHKGRVCLEQDISIGTNSHLLTQDEADQLECAIGYETTLYLVMIWEYKVSTNANKKVKLRDHLDEAPNPFVMM